MLETLYTIETEQEKKLLAEAKTALRQCVMLMCKRRRVFEPNIAMGYCLAMTAKIFAGVGAGETIAATVGNYLNLDEPEGVTHAEKTAALIICLIMQKEHPEKPAEGEEFMTLADATLANIRAELSRFSGDTA